MLRMSLPALDQLASNRGLESENSSETLTGSDLGTLLLLSLELGWTWPRSPFHNKSSLNYAILIKHPKKVLTLNGESSVIMSMKFSLRKVLRSLLTPKLDLVAQTLSMEDLQLQKFSWQMWNASEKISPNSSERTDLMQRASSKISIDINTSKCLPRCSAKFWLLLVSLYLKTMLSQLLRSMVTKTTRLCMHSSFKTPTASNTSSMDPLLVLSPLMLKSISISTENEHTKHWWGKSKTWLRKTALDFSSSSKTTTSSERAMFLSRNSGVFCMLKEFSWQMQNTMHLRLILPCQILN